MLIVDLALCGAALVFAFLFLTRSDNNIMIVVSYVCFSLSPLADFVDILARTRKGDTAGILDIYPTFLGGYLILLAVITAMIAAGIVMHKKRDVL